MKTFHVLAVSAATGMAGLVAGLLIGQESAPDPGKHVAPALASTATTASTRAGEPPRPVDAARTRAQSTSPRRVRHSHPEPAIDDRLALTAAQEVRERSELLQPLQELLSDLQAYDPEAADSLADVTGEDLVRIEDALHRLVHSSPDHLAYVIDMARDLPPGLPKDLLLSLIVQSNSPVGDDFARELVASGDHTQVVTGLEMIRDSGRTDPDTRADLIRVLQNNSEATVIRSAIEALTPQMIEPAEQHELLATLAPFRVHDDATIRASAIEKSAALSARDNGAEMLVQGLVDASPVVRAAAAFTASTSGIRSDHLRDQLFHVLEDTNEDWSVRHHAFNALRTYKNLVVEEYDSLKRFEAELTAVGEDQRG